MANFVLIYTGGGGLPDSPEAQQKVMEEWMGWFGALGDSVVDAGAPFGPSAQIAPDGSVKDTASGGLSGYSIVSAGSLAEATTKAKGCPVLAGGGTVQVYESMPMG
jgi:hypothetical protein